MEIVQLLKYDKEFDEIFSTRKEAREKLIAFCKMDSSFYYPLDSLKKYSAFRVSADEKMRIVSWDLFSGGTWHDYASMANFDNQGKGGFLNLHDKNCYMKDCEYEDVADYKIFDIQLNNQTNYLTFGYGTHGSGHHHKTVSILYFDGSELKQHSSFLDGKGVLNILSARRDKTDLKYDVESKTMSHKEFDFSYDTGFAKATGKFLTYKLTNSGFVKQ